MACYERPVQSSPPVVKYINPEGLSQPRGYSHVVEVRGGRTVYISGQVPLDPAGAVVGERDFAAQTRQVFENLRLALAAANATFADLAKITVFMTDVSQLATFREIRGSYFGSHAPASSLVQVVQLFMPDVMIEIEAIAVVAAD
jgi:reactive intermediate/imine deaminase